jgi:hypothetical protein
MQRGKHILQLQKPVRSDCTGKCVLPFLICLQKQTDALRVQHEEMLNVKPGRTCSNH